MEASQDRNTGRNGNHGSNTDGKPNKRSFYNTVVVTADGTLVDERDWKKKAGNKEGNDLKKALKNEGWTPVRVFNQRAYDEARAEFRDVHKKLTQESRRTMIQQALDDAGVENHSRLESALRIVMPLLDQSNERRVIKTLSNIAKMVDANMDDKQRSKATGDDDGEKDATDDKKTTVH